jgi:hypothetical protein
LLDKVVARAAAPSATAATRAARLYGVGRLLLTLDERLTDGDRQRLRDELKPLLL